MTGGKQAVGSACAGPGGREATPGALSSGDTPDPDGPGARRPGTPRWREFAWLLLGGAAGAGIVLFCAHQPAVRVIVSAPRPLPDSVTTLRLSDLRPAVPTLAVAALASLAAAVATRRMLRRIVALLTVALGAGMALLAVGGVSRAEAVGAATRAAASPATGSGAGSVTAGAGSGQAGGPLAGLPARVLLLGAGWHWLLIGGVALMVMAAVTIAIRADRLPEMSSRYGRADGLARIRSARTRPAAREGTAPRAVRPGSPGHSGVTLWESLSAGADPTTWPGDEDA